MPKRLLCCSSTKFSKTLHSTLYILYCASYGTRCSVWSEEKFLFTQHAFSLVNFNIHLQCVCSVLYVPIFTQYEIYTRFNGCIQYNFTSLDVQVNGAWFTKGCVKDVSTVMYSCFQLCCWFCSPSTVFRFFSKSLEHLFGFQFPDYDCCYTNFWPKYNGTKKNTLRDLERKQEWETVDERKRNRMRQNVKEFTENALQHRLKIGKHINNKAKRNKIINGYSICSNSSAIGCLNTNTSAHSECAIGTQSALHPIVKSAKGKSQFD